MKPSSQAQLSQNLLANRGPSIKLRYQDKSQEKMELLKNSSSESELVLSS